MARSGLWPRGRSLAALVGLLVVAGVIVAARTVTGEGDAARQHSVPGQAITEPEPGFHVSSDAPIEIPSPLNAQAWTGKEAIAWGSSIEPGSQRSGGVAYNPDTGGWRVLPDAPFEYPLAMPSVSGVWTGKALVVVGTLCENRPAEAGPGVDDVIVSCFPGTVDSAAYIPDTDSWVELGSPPGVELPESTTPDENGGSLYGSATGRLGDEAVFNIAGSYWSISVSDGVWRELPNPPFSFVCQMGDDLASVGLEGGPSHESLDSATGSVSLGVANVAVIAAASGSRDWARPNASSELVSKPGQTAINTVCGGEWTMIYSIDLGSAWLYNGNEEAWAEIPLPDPTLTAPHGESAQSRVTAAFPYASWTGDRFVFWTSDYADETSRISSPGYGVAYDPISKAWSSAAAGPPVGSGLDWTDRGFSLNIGFTARGAGALTYKP